MADGPASLSSLVPRLLDEVAGPAASESRRAGFVWNSVNGDIERAHTTGVFVMPAKGPGMLPTLGVYVDSRTRAVDFRASRETYLARLDMAGLHFSDIRFLVSKSSYLRRREGDPKQDTPKPPLAPLSPEEEAHTTELVHGLPDGLREKALEAMRLSYRWNKTESTGK